LIDCCDSFVIDNGAFSHWKAENNFLLEECTEKAVVITGGEPLEQDIESFVDLLLLNGKLVQIETSGSRALLLPRKNLWQTVSPKFTKKTDHLFVIEQCKLADEVKVVITDETEVYIDTLCNSNKNVFVQPEFENFESSFKLCKQIARNKNVRISLQTHKFLNER